MAKSHVDRFHTLFLSCFIFCVIWFLVVLEWITWYWITWYWITDIPVIYVAYNGPDIPILLLPSVSPTSQARLFCQTSRNSVILISSVGNRLPKSWRWCLGEAAGATERMGDDVHILWGRIYWSMYIYIYSIYIYTHTVTLICTYLYYRHRYKYMCIISIYLYIYTVYII